MPPSQPPVDPFPGPIAPPPRHPDDRRSRHRRAGPWLRRGAYALTALLLALAASNRVGPPRLSPPTQRHLALTLGLWRATPDGDLRSARHKRAWLEVAPPEHDLVEATSLVELARRGVACVLVADARRLDDAALAQLERYVRDGGGAVIAGAIAVEDGSGEWLGFERMQKLLGVREVRSLLVRAEEQAPTLRAWQRSSLTAEMGPGETVPLVRGHRILGIPHAEAAIGWFDGDASAGLAAAHVVEIGRGRLVWLAAHPADRMTNMPGLASHYEAMSRLARGAIAWAARQPLVEILPWPSAAPFAATWDGGQLAKRPLEVAALEQQWLERAARARTTAERAVLSLPSELPGPEREALRAIGERLLRDQGAWIASESEVSSWSLQRAGLVAAFEQPGERDLIVYVSNRSRRPLEGAVLRVHANRSLGGARLQRQEAGPESAATLSARIALHHGSHTFDLELPPLPPGGQRAYEIEFEPLPQPDPRRGATL